MDSYGTCYVTVAGSSKHGNDILLHKGWGISWPGK